MTEQTDKSAAAPELKAADLDLVSSLADAGKDEGEIWNEIVTEEKASQDPPHGRDEASAQGDATAQRAEATAGKDASKPGDDVAKPADQAGRQSADIWASAPAELREAFEAERAEKERLAHRVSSDAGRVAALQRRYEELKKAAQPKEPGRREVKDPKDVLAALKEEYPDIAEPLSQALDHINGTVRELSQAEESRREAAATALTRTETELAEAIRAETSRLTEAHPDWHDFLKEHGGNKLTAWLDDQPRRIRDAFAINGEALVDADAAILFLDAYKKFVNPPASEPAPNPLLNDRRRRQLDATATPSGKGGKPVVSGIPEEGDPEAIWKAIAEEERRRGVAA